MEKDFQETLRKEERDRLKAHQEKQDKISAEENKALKEVELEILRLFQAKSENVSERL